MRRYIINVVLFALGFILAYSLSRRDTAHITDHRAYVNYPCNGQRKSVILDVCSSSTRAGYSEKEIDEDESFERSYWIVSVNGQNYVLVPSE